MRTSRRENAGTLLLIVATVNVTSSAGLTPPTKLPEIVISSPTSYPDPALLTTIVVIFPDPSVVTSKVAPVPSKLQELLMLREL